MTNACRNERHALTTRSHSESKACENPRVLAMERLRRERIRGTKEMGQASLIDDVRNPGATKRTSECLKDKG